MALPYQNPYQNLLYQNPYQNNLPRSLLNNQPQYNLPGSLSRPTGLSFMQNPVNSTQNPQTSTPGGNPGGAAPSTPGTPGGDFQTKGFPWAVVIGAIVSIYLARKQAKEQRRLMEEQEKPQVLPFQEDTTKTVGPSETMPNAWAEANVLRPVSLGTLRAINSISGKNGLLGFS